MAFFSEDEIGSLRIESMILHVVGDNEFRPERAREVEHEDFFIGRICDTDVAPVFELHPESQTKTQIEQMASGQTDFETGGQSLSREFSRFHHGGSRDGAFFVFELGTSDPDVRIYSLIKYDYQEVIEQQHSEDGDLLRLIVQAFVADKRAIQKSALIRVVDGEAEMAISAKDRMKAAPEIGDYFANFLHVVRARNDEQLNAAVIDVLRGSLKELREHLPDRNIPRAFREAKTALANRQRINNEAVKEAMIAAVGHPDDENVIAKLENCVRRKIRSAKLEGLEFAPDRQQLRNPAIRRVRTTEGVTIYYPDAVDNANVDRRPLEDGGETITITTRRVEEDGIVRREPRRKA